MAPEHPRSGVPHNLLNRSPGLGFVTVDPAVTAGWLVLLKGAGLQPLMGIDDESPACIAWLGPGFMMGTAIERHHCGYSLLFLLNS